MATIEEGAKIGLEKNRRASEKRKAKLFNKEIEVKVSVLKKVIRSLCAEYNQKVNLYWTGREWKAAKNFIIYCESENDDPREVLRDVIRQWSRFYSGSIIGLKSGRAIRLSKSFDFGQFFSYRTEIMDWVNHHQVSEQRVLSEKYIIKEINLRGGGKNEEKEGS